MKRNYTAEEFEKALAVIENADDYQIGDICRTVIKRHKKLFPGWQVIFLSVPADNEEEHLESIRQMLEFLKVHKTL